jgi:type IV pilus modification protein PilV
MEEHGEEGSWFSTQQEFMTITELMDHIAGEVVMKRFSARPTTSGFSLIETNVALFILIVGFLGVSGLVLSTINDNTYNRNLALADDFSTNLMEFWRGAEYDKVTSFLSSCGTSCTAVNYATEQTPAFGDTQLNESLTTWKQQIAAGLPSGRGEVKVTKSTTSPYKSATIDVTVQWVQKGAVYHAKKTIYRADI